MSDEPTEDQGSAAAEGANEPLRRAAAHAREIVVPDPDSDPPLPMALGDAIEDAAAHPERRVSRPPRREAVDPDVMYRKLVFGEDGELPPAADLGDVSA